MVYLLSNSRERAFDFLKKKQGKEEIRVSLTHLLENLGTYVQESSCYEAFAIYHFLIYVPFDS